jgi:hypothetical protein
LSLQRRIKGWFDLGARLDAAGRYDEALQAWNIGNAIQDRLVEWTEPDEQEAVDTVLKIYPQEKTGKILQKDADLRPIFIVGMPRSGSTLLEQAITAHPDVAGGGELTVLGECIGRHEKNALSADLAVQIGHDYLNQVRHLAKGKPFITDKLPANFFYVGIIAMAMPHAKILHTQRHAADVCLSCWSKLFNAGNLGWSYDMGSMERYYLRYAATMRHWRNDWPGSFRDVPYTSMVYDTRDSVAQILSYLGLTWNDACAKPHENERAVKTASRNQVKKPIYTTSVERWKNYRAQFERFAHLESS